MPTNGFKQIVFLVLAFAALDLRSSAISAPLSFRGKIADIHVNTDQAKNLGTVLVAANDKAKPDDKLILIITKETRVYEQQEARREITLRELKIGNLIEARLTGPMMESYPGQVAAAEIVQQSSIRSAP